MDTGLIPSSVFKDHFCRIGDTIYSFRDQTSWPVCKANALALSSPIHNSESRKG